MYTQWLDKTNQKRKDSNERIQEFLGQHTNKSFHVVFVSNALYIVPQPEKSLQELIFRQSQSIFHEAVIYQKVRDTYEI